MIAKRILPGLLIACVAPASIAAQVTVTGRAATFYESYSFDTGDLDKITQLAIPIGADVAFADFGVLSISGGYATVDLNSAAGAALPDQSLSGVIDTELRFTYNLVPDRFYIVATGVVPTGINSVQVDELSVLGALSNDLVSFSLSSLGSGGSLGGGFVAAIPVGSWALGFGATANSPLQYQPVTGTPDELKPGFEFRVRGGLQGALGQRTYLRIAAIFARKAKDELSGQTQNGIGNRVIGYVSLNQAIARGTLTLYAFDVFRADPQLEQTVVGTASLPKGNLIAGGFRLTYPLSPKLTVTPRAEYRNSRRAPDEVSSLEDAGSSIRFGADIRYALARSADLVLLGSGLTGDVVELGNSVGVSGYRFGLMLELKP